MASYENYIKGQDTLDFGSAIQGLIQDNLKKINTIFIAKVVSINENKLSVVNLIKDSEDVENVVINNVLCAQPFSESGLFFKVKEGDVGLCFVCKSDISNYKETGDSSVKNTDRIFSIIDSVFMPCSLFNQFSFDSDSKENAGLYFSENVILKNGDKNSLTLDSNVSLESSGNLVMKTQASEISIQNELITIKNSTTSLLTLLSDLIDILSSLTTIPAVVGSALTLNPSVIAQLTTFKAQLQTLFKE